MNKKYLLSLVLILMGIILGTTSYAEEKPNGVENKFINKEKIPMDTNRGVNNRRPAITGIIKEINGDIIKVESINIGKIFNKETETDSNIYTIETKDSIFYRDGKVSKIEEFNTGERIMAEGQTNEKIINAIKIYEGNMGRNGNGPMNRIENNRESRKEAGFWNKIGSFFGKMFNKR